MFLPNAANVIKKQNKFTYKSIFSCTFEFTQQILGYKWASINYLPCHYIIFLQTHPSWLTNTMAQFS